MRVEVYRNLKHGRKAPPLYSVRYKGKVIRRVRRALLTNVVFKVSEAGRQRVLKEGRKNVHAFVVGDWTGPKGAYGMDKNDHNLPVRVAYNPYVAGHFLAYGLISSDIKVKGAGAVLLNEHGMSACMLS